MAAGRRDLKRALGAFLALDLAQVGRGAAARLATLTPRERQVFDALIRGRSNKEIALDLDISPRTVEIFRAKVMQKMQADSLSALVRMGLRIGDA